MAEYVKKILVFDELAGGYRVRDKKVSGILKIEKSLGRASAEIMITNLDRKKAESVECVLYVGGGYYSAVSDGVKFSVPLRDARQHDDAACLLAAVEGNERAPFAFASNCDRPSADDLAARLGGSVSAAATQYEDFIRRTDDYFGGRLDMDEIRKASAEKFAPVTKLGEIKTGDGGFFAEAAPILEKILKTYPPCDELSAAVKDSFWVRVPFRREKFFAVGVVEKNGSPAFVAYAVPGGRKNAPDDESFSFLPVKNREEGFWVIYQDIRTGACALP